MDCPFFKVFALFLKRRLDCARVALLRGLSLPRLKSYCYSVRGRFLARTGSTPIGSATCD